jgi:hypothetical protein
MTAHVGHKSSSAADFARRVAASGVVVPPPPPKTGHPAQVADVVSATGALVVRWRALEGPFASDLQTFDDRFSLPRENDRLSALYAAVGLDPSETDPSSLSGRGAVLLFDGDDIGYRAHVPEKPKNAFAFDLGPKLAESLPPLKYLSKRFRMVKGRPIIISGQAGSAKTWLAMALGLSVAAGRGMAWGGIDVQLSGAIRHLDYENIDEVSARRYQRLAHGLGINLAALGDRIGRAALPRVHLTDDGAEEALAQACVGVELVIIDSLRAACPRVDENSSTIRDYLDLLTRVTQRTGTIFVVIHHEGKAPTEGRRSAQDRARGSTAIVDAIDCQLSVTKEGGDVYKIEQGKESWGSADPLIVKLVDIGPVDDATSMHAGLCIELADESASIRLDTKLTNAMAQIVLALRRSDRPLGATELRETVKVRHDTANSALKILKERGEVVQDASKKYLAAPEKAKSSTKSSVPDVPEDSGDAAENASEADRKKPRKKACPRVSPHVPGTRDDDDVPMSRPLGRGHRSGTRDTDGMSPGGGDTDPDTSRTCPGCGQKSIGEDGRCSTCGASKDGTKARRAKGDRKKKQTGGSDAR